MTFKKTDFQISYESEGCYRVQVLESFLYLFKRWVFLTCQETENSDESLMEFLTFKEAENFINLITE